jgi:hypothetical protein
MKSKNFGTGLKCDTNHELTIFGLKCKNCGKVYIGELDAAVLHPELMKNNYFVVKHKRALSIDRRKFKCKCGSDGSEFKVVPLLYLILKDDLKKYVKHLKIKFKKIRNKLQYA